MEFRELKTFQVVASLLSFNKAARVLNYAQSTVSSQIQSLENSLGEPLFIRAGSKIRLTAAGVTLLQYTQRLISLENEILGNFKSLNETTGSLIIKTPHSMAAYYLPPVIREFQKQFPSIGFDFDACVGFNINEIFNAGLIDVAFLFCDNFTDNILIVEELMPVNMVFVAHPENKEFKKPLKSIRDFHNKTLLLSKNDCSYRMTFERMLLAANVQLAKTIEINSPEAVKNLLLQGHNAVALLPEIAVQKELKKQTLKSIPWKGPDLNMKIYMIRKKDKFLTGAARAFIDAVKQHFVGLQ